ncbi:hypothetical protein [Spirosoma oryzicola]|uniref:hypothetical protein n=1 Tax=Spirosoma oryzicola TaxID=2898794 RepID=UPI001E4C1F72|nr:hypothetical protein [Spirosoma oryzicola]UHG94213.1 hypothetical protein LQ777_26960 [Spirosoma oryzicola]
METSLLSFSDYLTALVEHRQYVKVQYFTEFHELITLNALIVHVGGKGTNQMVGLSSGEQIPLSKLVSAGGQFAPNFEGYAPYCETCDS